MSKQAGPLRRSLAPRLRWSFGLPHYSPDRPNLWQPLFDRQASLTLRCAECVRVTFLIFASSDTVVTHRSIDRSCSFSCVSVDGSADVWKRERSQQVDRIMQIILAIQQILRNPVRPAGNGGNILCLQKKKLQVKAEADFKLIVSCKDAGDQLSCTEEAGLRRA